MTLSRRLVKFALPQALALMALGLVAYSIVTIAWPLEAHAQEQPEDPPYEQDLMRLSEILGAMHYLRPLCGHDDGMKWREEMQALIEAEVQDDNRKRRFIERFNQGYRGFSSVYRSCTAAAQLTLERYVSEAAAIVRNITTRYNR